MKTTTESAIIRLLESVKLTAYDGEIKFNSIFTPCIILAADSAQ